MFANAANLFRIGIIALIVCAVGAIMAPPAVAQDDWAPFYIAVDNEYIGLAIGTAGKWKLPDPPFNHWLIPAQPLGGRWQIYTTGGDPTTTQDNSIPLIYSELPPPMPGDKWAAFQLMVDGTTTPSGAEGAGSPAWASFTRGGTSAITGDWVDGYWTVWPYTPTDKLDVIAGTWYPDTSKGTSSTGVTTEMTPFDIRCDMEAKLMRDTVRFKWTITNEDKLLRDHLIGLRSYADVTPSALLPDPLLSDYGTEDLHTVISIPGRPLVTDRTVLFAKDIPSVVDMFNSREDPSIALRFTMKGQGATTPDVVGIDDWELVAWSGWTYGFGAPAAGGDSMAVWQYDKPIPFHIIEDVGYGVFWKPRRVAPRSSITFVTYVGLGSATSDFTKPNVDHPQYVVAAQGPRALKYTNEVTGSGELYPTPFTIHSWMYNTEKFIDLLNPSFTLTLPSGLELDASEGGKYSKSLAGIGAGAEGHVSWKVVPVGQPTGILDYTVSVSTAPVGGSTIRRQINIPATENQPLMLGWQMVSVPFSLNNPDPASALGIPAAVLYRYDPYRREYQKATRLMPGEAYWMKLSSGTTARLTPGEFSPLNWNGTQGYQIPLQVGWNLVGNPYVYAYTLGECRFYHRDYGSVTYDEALKRGLLSNTIFWWDPLFSPVNGQYKWASDRSVQIKPWQGYWIKANREGVILVVSPASQIGAAVGGLPTSEDEGDTGGGGGPAGP